MIRKITLPELGEGINSVEVSEVRVKPGDSVKKDDAILVVETDKASMEIPSPFDGAVREIRVKVSDSVTPGHVLATVEVSAAALVPEPKKEKQPEVAKAEESQRGAPVGTESKPAPSNAISSPVPVQTAPVTPAKPGGVSPLASPAVRRFARELGADLSRVQSSGPKNRILKKDVEYYIKSTLSLAQPDTGFRGAPAEPIDFSQWGAIETSQLNKVRRLTGEKMQAAWRHIPHVTQFDESDITELEAFRQEQKGAVEVKGAKLTLLPFIMKAVVAALKAYPDFNASLDPSGEQLILKKYFHLGVAVDTSLGLMVPVIRDVDKKSIVTLALELADVSARTRDKKITPAELQGGSFTISSLGGISGTGFTPIVKSPEVAILGVSRSTTKPVFMNNAFIPRLILPFSLSYDHRVIDGAAGARFTRFISEKLTDIRRLIL